MRKNILTTLPFIGYHGKCQPFIDVSNTLTELASKFLIHSARNQTSPFIS